MSPCRDLVVCGNPSIVTMLEWHSHVGVDIVHGVLQLSARCLRSLHAFTGWHRLPMHWIALANRLSVILFDLLS
jgi:hypothetical protein